MSQWAPGPHAGAELDTSISIDAATSQVGPLMTTSDRGRILEGFFQLARNSSGGAVSATAD
jgi:hypothetical protein